MHGESLGLGTWVLGVQRIETVMMNMTATTVTVTLLQEHKVAV